MFYITHETSKEFTGLNISVFRKQAGVLTLLTKWELSCKQYLTGNVTEYKNAYRILILKNSENKMKRDI
jgi:hypothetical protein